MFDADEQGRNYLPQKSARKPCCQDLRAGGCAFVVFKKSSKAE